MLKNKFFIIMSFFVIFTFILYNYKVFNFINESEYYVVVLEGEIDEKEKEKIVKNLEKMTFQDVELDQLDKKTYIKIRCPMEKQSFFKNWILNSLQED